MKPLLSAEPHSSLLGKLDSHKKVMLIMRRWRQEHARQKQRGFESIRGLFDCGKKVHLTLQGIRAEHKRVSVKLMHFSKLSPTQINVIIIIFLFWFTKGEI